MDEQMMILNGELTGQPIVGAGEDVVSGLAERLDFLDIQILRKFYMIGKAFPYDTQSYCFPILYKEMKIGHHLKIGIEAFRKRLDNLAKLEVLVKIRQSNPTIYSPIDSKRNLIRGTILKFFIINGLNKYL